MTKTLKDMKIGEEGVVKTLACEGKLKRRLCDMGVTPGAHILVRKVAPLGDPIEVTIRGYELSMRKAEAENVMMEVAE